MRKYFPNRPSEPAPSLVNSLNKFSFPLPELCLERPVLLQYNQSCIPKTNQYEPITLRRTKSNSHLNKR